jgi:hypothetical protein
VETWAWLRTTAHHTNPSKHNGNHTLRNSYFNSQKLFFAVFACFLQFSEKARIISLNTIKEVVFLMKAVFCEAGAESLKVN